MKPFRTYTWVLTENERMKTDGWVKLVVGCVPSIFSMLALGDDEDAKKTGKASASGSVLSEVGFAMPPPAKFARKASTKELHLAAAKREEDDSMMRWFVGAKT